jgi:glucokinase
LLQELVAGVERGEAQVLGTALLRKDTAAREILEGTADDLALGLSHVVHLLNPEIIVLGGGLSLLGDPLRLAVADRLTRYLMHVVQPGPMIQISSLGEDVVPVGALSLAISKLLSA